VILPNFTSGVIRNENKGLKTNSIPLSVTLSSISNTGLATLTFNKDVYEIANLTSIDSNVLEVKTLAGRDSDPNNLNIT
jgi:hypothetical protein